MTENSSVMLESGEVPTEAAKISWYMYRQYMLAIAFECRIGKYAIAFKYY